MIINSVKRKIKDLYFLFTKKTIILEYGILKARMNVTYVNEKHEVTI